MELNDKEQDSLYKLNIFVNRLKKIGIDIEVVNS